MKRLKWGYGLNKMFDSWWKTLFFGEFLFIFIEGYLEVLLSANMTWDVPKNSFENTLFCRGWGIWLITVCLTIVPFSLLYIITRKIKILKRLKFHTKWGSLYHGLKMHERQQIFYFWWFIVRRCLYVYYVMIFLKSNSAYQVQALDFLNMLAQIYFGSYFPHKHRLLNRLEIFNELQIMLCTLHLMVFSDYVPDLETQYFMGWVFIVILTSMVIVNMFFILRACAWEIQLFIVKWYRRMAHWWMKNIGCGSFERRKPKAKPIAVPTPPAPVKVIPVPAKVIELANKIDPYQPSIVCLIKGKHVCLHNHKNEEIERVKITNKNEIISKDNWKHQSAPLNVMAYRHWIEKA